MDKELLKRYDQIANKIENMGGQAWDSLVFYTRMEHIVDASISLFIILVSVAIILLFIRQLHLGKSSENIIELEDNRGYFSRDVKKFKKRPFIFDDPEKNDYDLNGYGITFAVFAVLSLFMFVKGVSFIIMDIPKIVYPEPYVVKSLIDSIGGK